MRKIRVLIVDDSTVIRRLLSDSLAADPQIEIAGTAAHGRIALAKIPQVNPDVVTLDMEMPEMDGIATLVEIRKIYPNLPIVMFSTLTERGATATLDALAKGANDYVTKPANVGSVNAAMQKVREELVPRLKALCPSLMPAPSIPIIPRTERAASKSSQGKCRIDAVVIGSSTGGPDALQAIIPNLPASFPVPIVVVQHMPPIFTRHLAERLNQLSALTVAEATHDDPIHAGGVWIAPGDFHLGFKRVGNEVRTQLDQGTPENSCRPAVDVMFRSAVSIYGGNLLAVVLTGMGQDGARGCEPIHAAGGQILVQDQATSVVWGMPGAVCRAGLATSVQPLSQIARVVCDSASRNREPQLRGASSCR